MIAAIENFFRNTFGSNVVLATILIAVLPIIELRGAIPFGMSIKLWGGAALNNWQSFLYSFLGSSAVVPILALVFIPILNALKKSRWFSKLGSAIENRVKTKSDKIQKDAEYKATEVTQDVDKQRNLDKKFWFKVLGVFLFVAIPLPLTGVYTGTCIAILLGLNYWWTCGTVILGNAVAGVIMTLLSTAFSQYTHILLYIFFGLVIIFVLYEVISNMVKKKKNQHK